MYKKIVASEKTRASHNKRSKSVSRFQEAYIEQ